MTPFRNDGGWTDVPADPSPQEIRGRVDEAALHRKVRAVAEQAAELRRAAQTELAERSSPTRDPSSEPSEVAPEPSRPTKFSVVAITEKRGTVRVTDADGRTHEDLWQRDSTGWHRAGH